MFFPGDPLFEKFAKKHFKFLLKEYRLSIVESNSTVVSYRCNAYILKVCLEYDLAYVTIQQTGQHPMLSLSYIVGFKLGEKDTDHISRRMPDFRQDKAGALDRELRQQASLLRLHCDDLLRGDFSQEQEILAWSVERNLESAEKNRWKGDQF